MNREKAKDIELNFVEELYEKILPRNPFAIKRRLADRLFSNIIRRRDRFCCVRCGHEHNPKSRGLHVSHYFSRRREATRFFQDNVDSLCTACHFQWSHNEGRTDYEAFKRKQLGAVRYKKLCVLAKIPNEELYHGEPVNLGRRRMDIQKIKKFRAILDGT